MNNVSPIKEKFGEKCWFYWEDKKTCTQFRKSPESEPSFCSAEKVIFQHDSL